MAKLSALRFLWGTLTQGGADAFVQLQLATGLSGQTKVAYMVREIFLEFSGGLAVNGSSLEISITRKTQAAMPLISDKSVVFKHKRFFTLTTSGAAQEDQVFRSIYTEDDSVLIVEDPIYLQLDSNATGVVNSCYVRIGYQQVSISEVDRLTLLTNALA